MIIKRVIRREIQILMEIKKGSLIKRRSHVIIVKSWDIMPKTGRQEMVPRTRSLKLILHRMTYLILRLWCLWHIQVQSVLMMQHSILIRVVRLRWQQGRIGLWKFKFCMGILDLCMIAVWLQTDLVELYWEPMMVEKSSLMMCYMCLVWKQIC